MNKMTRLCKNRIWWHRMMLLFITFHFSLLASIAQVGTWRNYLAYHEVQQICATGDNLFVRASNDLYQYNLKDQSITTYDKVNGLSDTDIIQIAWNKQTKKLIIVYENSNIDLMDIHGNVTNIYSYCAKSMTEDKTVNYIFNYGKYAYLATGFGIVKVDMSKIEISETYNLSQNIISLDIRDNYLYALTEKEGVRQVIRGSVSDNLMEKSKWDIVDPTHYPAYIFQKDTDDWETYHDLVSTLKPGGPQYNFFGFLRFDNNRLYTCDGNTSDIPATIQILQDNDWETYQTDNISEQTGIKFVNIYCIDYDPQDINHIFAAVRSGLYEFQDGKFVKHYNSDNSPIESYNGKSKNSQLVTGLKFDKSGSLWMLNSIASTQSVIEYTKSGEFISHSVPTLMKYEGGKSNVNLSHIIIDSQGYLWFVNNNWVLPALYRYDTRDDSIIEYSYFVNQDGTAISGLYGVTSVTEDKDGNMWVGTDVGPFMLEKSQIEAENPYFTQVKIPRNDGTNYADYLLNKISITDICIDDGNRKWIGTPRDGVYLISADNLTQVQHFTKENSPLLSNHIKCMTINSKSGEVFFGTEKGLCSFISDATIINEEMTTDNVWAYPNPVTPDYSGLITIIGLSFNADVKIVSSNGALIAEGRSNGGSFTWDGKDKSGNRVASGIYMVETATSEGKKGTVCKIAIIK